MKKIKLSEELCKLVALCEEKNFPHDYNSDFKPSRNEIKEIAQISSKEQTGKFPLAQLYLSLC